MGVILFIFDLLALSFMPVLSFILANIEPKQDEVAAEPVAKVVETEQALPLFDWAANPQTANSVKVSDKNTELAKNLKDELFLILFIVILLLSPIFITILKVSVASLLLTLVMTAAIYIYKTRDNLKSFKKIYSHFLSTLRNLNIKNIKSDLKEALNYLKSQPRTTLIYTMLSFDAVYLDLLVAKISLDPLSTAAYIFMSVLVKIGIVFVVIALHSWLVEENILKTRRLNQQVLLIFFSASVALVYLLFIFFQVLGWLGEH
jgi:hypothetical protein